MNNQQINHQIAIDINNWTHTEGSWYKDSAGWDCYLPDYCNSISHALDLAKTMGMALEVRGDGYKAMALDNRSIVTEDTVLATAIAMTALAIVKAQGTHDL